MNDNEDTEDKEDKEEDEYDEEVLARYLEELDVPTRKNFLT